VNCKPEKAVKRILFTILCTLLIAGCATSQRQRKSGEVKEIRPGILAGYLEQALLPNSLAILPPPPVADSAGLALDNEISSRSIRLRDTLRGVLAAEDANLMFPQAADAFSCALGVPIGQKDTPHLYLLLRRTLSDAGFSTYYAKSQYQRQRPFVVNGEPICTPGEAEFLRTNGSYPSGHTAIGWAWALILSEVAPDRTDAILLRGRTYGESRIICNVHWYSDVVAGRIMGAATVARLHADPGFQADLKNAKLEFAVLRSKGVKPARDCQAEADALQYDLYLKP
jgi:acid phosphatase (class A)